MKASLKALAAGWFLALVCMGSCMAQQGPTCDSYGLSMSGTGLVDPSTGLLSGTFDLQNMGTVSSCRCSA